MTDYFTVYIYFVNVEFMVEAVLDGMIYSTGVPNIVTTECITLTCSHKPVVFIKNNALHSTESKNCCLYIITRRQTLLTEKLPK